MTTTTADEVVLLAHGSRDGRHMDGIERIRDRVLGRTDLPVRTAYLEFSEPTIDTLRIARGARVRLVPLLLSAGYHVRHDVPRVQRRLRARGVSVVPVAAPVMTRGDWPVKALRDLRADEVTGTVLVVTAGSSDLGVIADWDAAAARWSRAFGEVRVAHASGPGVRPEVVASRAAGVGRPVGLVVPAVVADGTFSDRVRTSAQGIGLPVTEVVGDGAAFADHVAHLCRSAC